VTSVIRYCCWMTTVGESGAGHWQPRGDRAGCSTQPQVSDARRGLSTPTRAIASVPAHRHDRATSGSSERLQALASAEQPGGTYKST